MKAKLTNRRILIAILVTITLAAGLIVSVLVFATGDSRLTITAYADVVRFQADGVATLQVRIFDLSGKVVWDSSVVSGDTIDWDRNNDFGERLAYGAYIYSAQGWSAEGDLDLQEKGKIALMPGDTVQLQVAPMVSGAGDNKPEQGIENSFQPKATYNEDLIVNGNIIVTGVGDFIFDTGDVETNEYIDLVADRNASSPTKGLRFFVGSSLVERFRITAAGNVGIGTTSPTARLEVESSTGQDLIAAYNSSNRVFVVKSTGEVRADGAYYSATGGFHTGSADVAERINTSECVEKGDVVEIDPEHPGFFRKSSSPYSTKVAGIISPSPGVILGNSFDKATDDWEDNRPVLAVTGRVPCKVSAENGPIEIGDLLVASSISGVAMKGNPEESMGAVVGKAMEPLEDGEGTIVVQVMLR